MKDHTETNDQNGQKEPRGPAFPSHIPGIPLAFGDHAIKVWAGNEDAPHIDREYYRSLLVCIDGRVSRRARRTAAHHGVHPRAGTDEAWLKAMLDVHPFADEVHVGITHDETLAMLRLDLWNATWQQRLPSDCPATRELYYYAAICRELRIAKFIPGTTIDPYETPERIAELASLADDPITELQEFLRAFGFAAGTASAEMLACDLRQRGVRLRHSLEWPTNID